MRSSWRSWGATNKTPEAGGVGWCRVLCGLMRSSWRSWVTATCGARNVDLVRSLGADEVLDYKTPEDENREFSIYDANELLSIVCNKETLLEKKRRWLQLPAYISSGSKLVQRKRPKFLAESYAISAYDNTTTLHLEFIKVVNGSTMYVSFWPRSQKIWLLWVEAKNCTNPDQSDIYQTEVYENFGVEDYRGHFPAYHTKSFVFLQKLG
ncbi:quinone-oxidoreductase [Carex littledalei]|uniref:Quinone-oxidoreductase n=1 Tax=Carex littledalei TaxID=544730 RepID=A0A833RHE5_9POAL|nr:quinone-oxidoreductase [Carex littledalei]